MKCPSCGRKWIVERSGPKLLNAVEGDLMIECEKCDEWMGKKTEGSES